MVLLNNARVEWVELACEEPRSEGKINSKPWNINWHATGNMQSSASQATQHPQPNATPLQIVYTSCYPFTFESPRYWLGPIEGFLLDWIQMSAHQTSRLGPYVCLGLRTVTLTEVLNIITSSKPEGYAGKYTNALMRQDFRPCLFPWIQQLINFI